MTLYRELFLEIVYRHNPWEMLLWGVTAIFLWIFMGYLLMRWNRGKRLWCWLNRILFVLILFLIIDITLFRRSGGKREVSLIPFYSFTYSFSSDRYNTLMANMLLFLPLGLSIPFILPEKQTKHPIRLTIIAALMLSAGIEIFQYIFKLGLCETDDVIFNTIGAALGTISFVVIRKKTSIQNDE